MGEIARRTSIPIATGERLVGVHEFQNLFEHGGCAFAQPDLGSCGGITACKKIATLAEAKVVADFEERQQMIRDQVEVEVAEVRHLLGEQDVVVTEELDGADRTGRVLEDDVADRERAAGSTSIEVERLGGLGAG